MKPLFAWLIAGAALFGLGSNALAQAPGAQIGDPAQVAISLIAAARVAAPGETMALAFVQEIAPNWHIYWTNPGASGEPTQMTFEAPAGFVLSAPDWPTPTTIPLGPLVNYGYSGEVVYPLTLTIPPDAPPGPFTIGVKARWLVCEEICIPEEGEAQLLLAVGETPVPDPTNAARIAAGQDLIPVPSPFDSVISADGAGLLAIRDPALAGSLAAGDVNDAYFFADDPLAVDPNAPQAVRRGPDGLSIALTAGYGGPLGDKPLTGVLALQERDSAGWRWRGYRLTASPGDVGEGVTDAALAPASTAPPATSGLGQSLAFAFVGGILLNLMPCVFPVLFMKAQALLRSAAGAQAHARREGLFYGAGVVASFAALGGALWAIRAGGAEIGWGFQLQSAPIVAAFAVLFFLIGLNFLGVFDIGASAQNLGSSLSLQSGGSGAFFTGVLAVAAAAPCTAPFMATALGYALAAPALQAGLVFVALGLGMAAPFVGLSFWPALTRALPRPGPWMERAKQIMAFPLFATAVFMIWTLAQETNADGIGITASLIVLAGLGAFLLNLARSTLVRGVGLAIMAAALGLAALVPERHGAVAGTEISTTPTDGVVWETWSPAAVAQARAAGVPVFVNFTAAWCLPCQVNDRTTFSSSAVRAAFAESGVRAFKADWTRRDAQIATALAELGRAGVPTYPLYPADGGAPAFLPQILTPAMLIQAVSNNPR
ncbi:MAG TPA: thiol:disulfide interchange protein [Hyphomonadaceae bacterium]|nr:thiol:disulfide interchange protein [Hyphomonadaceae bacterium]